MTAFYKSKRVLVTGHTGFKGSWLCEWLVQLGAEVYGIALEPETEPSLFNQLDLRSRMHHDVCDLRDREGLCDRILAVMPDIVFHLAAQPLVRLSYDQPIETFEVNVMGTLHVLDVLRRMSESNPNHSCAAVMITTDKCYENREWLHGYREEDPMGGYDPYSASKGCAELAISSYRRSFFSKGQKITVASARAGNVIGGGDWALDRIVPDMVRALQKGEVIPVRNKTATRPWQHVLEPLGGYLNLGERLYGDASYAEAFNFGPPLSSNRTVAELVQEALKYWEGDWKDCSDPDAHHEAGKLNLSTDKAYHRLGWQPHWDFETTIAKTILWYKGTLSSSSPVRDNVLQDIQSYSSSSQTFTI